MKSEGRMRATASGLSDVGLQREHNEDSFAVLSEFDLFIVADGMGGHRAGDVASRLATETIAEFFRSTANEDVTWPFHFDTSLSEEENRLLTGIRIANRQIYDRSAKSRECRGMGTTVVGALYSPKKNRMYIGHVGDSRCYRVRGGMLRQMTRDHSLINDYLLAMPDLTEEQKNELPKNVITRALGMQDHVMVDMQYDEPEPGDLYLLCSDGLSGMIADDEIREILTSSRDLREACQKLVHRANEHGGEDNITAIVVRIEPLVATEPEERPVEETLRPQAPAPSSDAPAVGQTSDTLRPAQMLGSSVTPALGSPPVPAPPVQDTLRPVSMRTGIDPRGERYCDPRVTGASAVSSASGDAASSPSSDATSAGAVLKPLPTISITTEDACAVYEGGVSTPRKQTALQGSKAHDGAGSGSPSQGVEEPPILVDEPTLPTGVAPTSHLAKPSNKGMPSS